MSEFAPKIVTHRFSGPDGWYASYRVNEVMGTCWSAATEEEAKATAKGDFEGRLDRINAKWESDDE